MLLLILTTVASLMRILKTTTTTQGIFFSYRFDADLIFLFPKELTMLPCFFSPPLFFYFTSPPMTPLPFLCLLLSSHLIFIQPKHPWCPLTPLLLVFQCAKWGFTARCWSLWPAVSVRPTVWRGRRDPLLAVVRTDTTRLTLTLPIWPAQVRIFAYVTFDWTTPLHSFYQCAFVLGDIVRLELLPSLSGPPSAPRNAISNVNETSVFLEWSVPMETGGRKDVRYNILCRRVLPDGRGLEECGPNVRFLPRRVGLTNTSVMVADLQSHTNYSFLLEAVNGVSELAKDHAKQYVSLNVTTNQAGRLRQICHKYQYFLFVGNPSLHLICPISTTAGLVFLPQYLNFLPKEVITILLWFFIFLLYWDCHSPTCVSDSWCDYLGLITKTPDDQIITVFVQQICWRINSPSCTIPAVRESEHCTVESFFFFAFASRFVIEKAAWSPQLGRAFHQQDLLEESVA